MLYITAHNECGGPCHPLETTSTHSVCLLRPITLYRLGCWVVERIDRVVWQGRVITPDHVQIGRLIYRNDEIFFKQRRWILKITLVSVAISFIIVLICLFGMLFFGFGALYILDFFAFSLFLLSFLISYNNWRSVDHGIGVHENGLDAIEMRSFSVPRVFIPYEEIGHLRVGWIRFTVQLKSSKKKFFCSSKMVDEMTIKIAEELRRGERPPPGKPKLVIYGGEGASVITRS